MLTISNEFDKNVRRFVSNKDHYGLRDEIKIIDNILSLEHIEDSMIIDELDLIHKVLLEELADRFVKEDFMCHCSPGQICDLQKNGDCDFKKVV